jgi:hypothetical protein
VEVKKRLQVLGKCLAIADVRMNAEDDSNFNAGEYIDIIIAEIPDDWFLTFQKDTFFGYDYKIYDWEGSNVEWEFKYK